jgi:hypothetical protein
MALIRPERNLAVEGSPELTLEQQILGELNQIKDSQAFMRVVLLGGTYLEVPHEGKLPMLDGMIKLQAAHITLLEKRTEMLEDEKKEREGAARATARATKFVSTLLGALSGAAATCAVNLLTKK